MSAVSWLMICGGFTGVLVTEKFLKGNARPVVLSGFVLGAIFFYILNIPAMASNYMILKICICSISFFSGFIQPLAFGYIAKYYPERITGTLGGILIGLDLFIGMASVTVCTKTMEISGYHMSFIILIGVAMTGAFAALFLKPVD